MFLGVDKDGYKGPNRDTTRSLMSNYAYDLQLINEALLSLENQEIYQLDLQHKASIVDASLSLLFRHSVSVMHSPLLLQHVIVLFIAMSAICWHAIKRSDRISWHK